MRKTSSYKSFIVTMIACISYLTSYSQFNKVSYSTQYWYQYYNQISLGEKWNITSDIGIRFKNNHTTINQALLRIGAQYKINKLILLGTGFANFTSYKENKLTISEMRIWQEISAKHIILKLQIHHRFRTEERFFTDLPTKSKQKIVRLRYRLYCTYPLNHKTIENKTIYLIIGDEFFVNYFKANQSIQNTLQNRALAGFGFKLNDELNFTATYVSQLAQRNKLTEWDEATIIWIGINHTINIKSKKIQQQI